MGAVALATAALLSLALTHTTAPMAPLRLLVLALTAFAAWAFCEEMGLHKPLNRGGFVLFAIASAAKVQLVLGVAAEHESRYRLLYGAFLLLAVLLWSAAFMHREPVLRRIGTIGLIASLAPVALLVAGHVGLGVGVYFGADVLLSATDGTIGSEQGFVIVAERVFGIWGYVAAWLLWRGHIRFSLRQA